MTPDIQQASPPKPLRVPPLRRSEDVFQEQNYNAGGLYQPATLDAMQDFLLTPLLREAVTYKLAQQVHNMQPKNMHALGPLDVFPTDVAAAPDWRNLLFGGWWSWLEKWGKLASIILGIYYLYVVGRWPITTLFSLKVLYKEHGFGPNLLWGLGPGQDIFPMRFFRRWRQFKQHFSQAGLHEIPRAPPSTVPHEYLALNEMDIPQLPGRNRTMSNVYPVLPHQKHTSLYDNGPPVVTYATPERRAPAEEPLQHQRPPVTDLPPGPRLTQPPRVVNNDAPGGRCSPGLDHTDLNDPGCDQRSGWLTSTSVWRSAPFLRRHL